MFSDDARRRNEIQWAAYQQKQVAAAKEARRLQLIRAGSGR